MVIYKSSTHSSLWYIQDSTRSTFNPQEDMLWPNLQSPESTNLVTLGNNVNFLANGFQIRNADGDQTQLVGRLGCLGGESVLGKHCTC